MKNKNEKIGLVTYKKEFQKGFFHIKIRIETDKVIDTIWFDNQAENYDLQSGQYCTKGSYIKFELKKMKTNGGKKFNRLVDVFVINFETNSNKILHYTKYQTLKQIENMTAIEKIVDKKENIKIFF
jgi:hypothetical protein